MKIGDAVVYDPRGEVPREYQAQIGTMDCDGRPVIGTVTAVDEVNGVAAVRFGDRSLTFLIDSLGGVECPTCGGSEEVELVGGRKASRAWRATTCWPAFSRRRSAIRYVGGVSRMRSRRWPNASACPAAPRRSRRPWASSPSAGAATTSGPALVA